MILSKKLKTRIFDFYGNTEVINSIGRVLTIFKMEGTPTRTELFLAGLHLERVSCHAGSPELAAEIEEIKSFVFNKLGEQPKKLACLMETVADIAYYAGEIGFYGGNSRKDMQDFIQWTKDFQDQYKDVDWNTTDLSYMLEVDKFSLKKLQEECIIIIEGNGEDNDPELIKCAKETLEKINERGNEMLDKISEHTKEALDKISKRTQENLDKIFKPKDS